MIDTIIGNAAEGSGITVKSDFFGDNTLTAQLDYFLVVTSRKYDYSGKLLSADGTVTAVIDSQKAKLTVYGKRGSYSDFSVLLSKCEEFAQLAMASDGDCIVKADLGTVKRNTVLKRLQCDIEVSADFIYSYTSTE